MKKVLIEFADGDFLVSPQLAERVKQTIPSGRFDATEIEVPDPAADLHKRLTGASKEAPPSTFDRYRKDDLTPNQKRLVGLFTKHMTPPPKPTKQTKK
jgi:hypothetical protein